MDSFRNILRLMGAIGAMNSGRQTSATTGRFDHAKLSPSNRRYKPGLSASRLTRDEHNVLAERVRTANATRKQSRQEQRADLRARCYKQSNLDTLVQPSMYLTKRFTKQGSPLHINCTTATCYARQYTRNLRRAMARSMARDIWSQERHVLPA